MDNKVLPRVKYLLLLFLLPSVSSSECAEGHVKVARIVELSSNGTPITLESKCFPQAHLLEPCRHSEQCMSLTPSSFCGFSEIFEDPITVCVCKPGYILTGSLSKCIPIRKCTRRSVHSNDFSINQGDCESYQACFDGQCICLPNYEFNSLGQCIPKLDEDFGELKINLLKEMKTNFDKQSQNFLYLQCALVLLCLMIVLLFVVICINQPRTKMRKMHPDLPPKYSDQFKTDYDRQTYETLVNAL